MFLLPKGEVFRWALYLWFLNVLDWTVTRLIIAYGGHESNPLLVGWVDGPWGFFVKVVLVALIFWFFALRAEGSRDAVLLLALVCGIYLSIVVWNVVNFLAITA